MALKLLTILSAATGISVSAVPISNLTSSFKEIETFQTKNYLGLKEANDNNDNKNLIDSFNIEVKELQKNETGLFKVNTFPVTFLEALVPATSVTIPTTGIWNNAKNLKKQAADNNWKTWGFDAAALVAAGEGTNGHVTVKSQLVLSPASLAPLIADLNFVSHGVSATSGKLIMKMAIAGGGIVSQVYYSSKTAGEVLLVQSNPVPMDAIEVIITMVGSIQTSDYYG